VGYVKTEAYRPYKCQLLISRVTGN
jgi:hypothetical protein